MSHSIGTTSIPTPHYFVAEDFHIRQGARLASGKQVFDVIATKKRFILSWVDMGGAELDALITLLQASAFLSYTYPDETGNNTVTVSAAEMPRELWLNYGGKKYRGIRVTLEEQ